MKVILAKSFFNSITLALLHESDVHLLLYLAGDILFCENGINNDMI